MSIAAASLSPRIATARREASAESPRFREAERIDARVRKWKDVSYNTAYKNKWIKRIASRLHLRENIAAESRSFRVACALRRVNFSREGERAAGASAIR